MLFSRDSPVGGGQGELDVPDASDAEGDDAQDDLIHHAGNIEEDVVDASSIDDVTAVEAFPPMLPPAYTFPPPPVLNAEVVEVQIHPVAPIQPAPNEANVKPPPPDLFDARMYILKSRLADLERQLVDQKRDSQEAEDRTSETNEAVQAALRMRDEAVAAVDALKEMVKGKFYWLPDTLQRSVNIFVFVVSSFALFFVVRRFRPSFNRAPSDGRPPCKVGDRDRSGA